MKRREFITLLGSAACCAIALSPVIVAVTLPMTHAAMGVTRTVPIVMAGVINPVENGLIESLARPGGNITGLTGVTGPEVYGKRMELLKELLPGLSRVAILHSKAEMSAGFEQTAEATGRELGVKVLLAEHANGLCGCVRDHRSARSHSDIVQTDQSRPLSCWQCAL
jgi:ABC-type uncharacterized transport system substrate-binding protein